MTRLHGAIQRATDGKAQLLPAESDASVIQGADVPQPAFAVPWTLDAEVEADEAAAAEPATPEDRRPAGWPTVRLKASIAVPSEVREKLVTAGDAASLADLAVAVEQYRKLAAVLHHAQGARGLKVVMVASANPGEGKSLTASNLALTLSESYQRRVLLIDGDLRRPSLHAIFGVPNDTGLSDGLARATLEGLAVVEVSSRLSVLPSGRPMADPIGALTAGQMRRILAEARAGYDWAVVDTPPINLLTDARLLAEMIDAVVLVVEAEKSPYPDVLRAIEAIGRERVIGVVLNRVRKVAGRANYYASYYRHSQASKA